MHIKIKIRSITNIYIPCKCPYLIVHVCKNKTDKRAILDRSLHGCLKYCGFQYLLTSFSTASPEAGLPSRSILDRKEDLQSVSITLALSPGGQFSYWANCDKPRRNREWLLHGWICTNF